MAHQARRRHAFAAIVCSRGRRKACAECGKTARKLCDFPLGGSKAGKTCSRPMCDACAKPWGKEIDYCRAHDELARSRGEKPAEVQGELFGGGG